MKLETLTSLAGLALRDVFEIEDTDGTRSLWILETPTVAYRLDTSMSPAHPARFPKFLESPNRVLKVRKYNANTPEPWRTVIEAEEATEFRCPVCFTRGRWGTSFEAGSHEITAGTGHCHGYILEEGPHSQGFTPCWFSWPRKYDRHVFHVPEESSK